MPFLQRVLGQFQLVPIIMGDQSYDACRALGVALAKLVQGTNTLIVASSDLSHYHTYDEAVRLDHKTLKAIGEYDYFDLSRNLELRVWEACGGGPIVAAMIAAERLGATQAKVLHYANTGDVTGDHSRVVGYGAVALVKAAGAAKAEEAPFSLTKAEKDALLKIARKSVETAVREGKTYECSTGGLEALAQERGAFVTLTKNGQLRGCIGYVAPIKPLYLTVRDVAMMAALRDTRFRPVTASELGRPAVRNLRFVPVAPRDGHPGDPRRAARLADPHAAATKACCCRRWPAKKDGTGLRSWRRFATRPACRGAHGRMPTPIFSVSPPWCSASAGRLRRSLRWICSGTLRAWPSPPAPGSPAPTAAPF